MREQEMETSYHIVILTVFTVMCMLLDIIILISDWGAIAVIPITLLCALCWALHLFDVGKGQHRLLFYIFVIIGILFYYAYFPYTITDIPILLCILIIILSHQKKGSLVIMVALSYLLYIFENIFITHFLNAKTEPIVFSRLALGIICLFGACVISFYFMRVYGNDENEKQRLKQEASDARNDTKQFLSNMSHELRTPINVVNGIAELMLSEQRNEKDEKNLYAIYNAGKRMQREVGDILSYSELQTGRFMLSEAEYEIVSVVNDSVNRVFGKAELGLDFAVDIAPDIPKTLYGDARRLTKLIVILLDNAVKFTDIGGGYLYVSKRDTDYGINLNIDVYDTGKGMDTKELRLYKDGAHAGDESMERKKGGLGLGLYIAHGIVTFMQGFMSIRSSEEGTHVHLTIPQKVVDGSPSIMLADADKYHTLCWFDRKKYIRREVGEYYYKVVEHVVKDIGVNVSVAGSIGELKEYAQTGKFTHVFIAQMEYETDPAFFEELSKKIWLCVFAGPNFKTEKGSLITVIPKPVYFLSVVNFLKQAVPGAGTALLSRSERIQEISFGGGVRALVVDDEKMNLMVARGILERMGVKVTTAESGEEAVEACKEADYDIIFMDYMMPGQNGTDAMKEIRRIRHGLYAHLPIVVLTANAVSGAREVFLNDGFDDFLSKPVGIREMQKCMKRFVSNYE